MTLRYAVTAGGEDAPTAVFVSFEDALAWGTLRFGADAFEVAEIYTQDVSEPVRRPQLPG